MGFQNNTAETEQILTENYERYYRLAYSYMPVSYTQLDVYKRQTSYLPDLIASTSLSHTPLALISGFKS